MGIPSDFSNKGLSGFHVSSSKLVKIEPHYQNAAGQSVTSSHESCFVRIDDPHAIDSNGMRLPDAKNAAISLVHESWLPRNHPDGTLTHGGKGAWLEYQNVLIPKNKQLWFRYNFLRFASLPTNAFAALLFFPNGDTNTAPLAPHWICCVKDLQQDQGGIYQTGWTEASVPVNYGSDFTGTVRWIVSTGHSVTSSSSIPDNTRFARPGCLLIDAIDIC